MQVTSVKDTLEEFGFLPPHLLALVPDLANYKALLMQPEGNITADSEGVRNTNTALADAQYTRFLQLANETNADLVATPEYSLPWRVLRSFIEQDEVPALGKLWALGCESITLESLQSFASSIATKATFIYEPLPPDSNRFLNPLVYLFQAPTISDADDCRLIVLIQFKTHPLGDEGHFEVNGLQLGSRLYQFGGTDTQLRFITMICSDAFAFTEENASELYDRTLVLHIQLNPNPRQNLFRLYRTHLLKYHGDQTEIVTLNWARNIHARLCTGATCWNNISGSAWYLRPDKFDLKDASLQHNHSLGLYYTWLHVDRCHALFFSYAPAVFLVVATKVAHLRVAGPLSRRLGPKMEVLYQWSTQHQIWESIPHADDEFLHTASTDAGDAAEQLTSVAQANALAVERILALCAGVPVSRSDWYKVTLLDSCQIDLDEIIRRVTFCHDKEAKATTFRRSRLRTAQRALRLLNQNLPPTLRDLEAGFSFDWCESSPHTNIKSDTGRRATVIALDDSHGLVEAKKTRDTFAEYLRRTASSADEGFDAMQRLCVWYSEQGHDALCEPHRFTNYDQTLESPFDIGRAS